MPTNLCVRNVEVRRPWRHAVVQLLAIAVFFLAGTRAWGAPTYTYIGGNNSVLNTTTNWSPIGPPGAVSKTVFNGTIVTSPSTFNLNGNMSFGELAFQIPVASNVITFNEVAGNLTLGNTTAIDLSNTTANVIINVPLALFSSSPSFAINSTTTLTITGSISGTGISQIDGGTLVLSGSNSLTSGMSLLNGTLAVNNAHALGTGTVALGNTALGSVSLDNTSGAAITLSTNNAISLNGTVDFLGTNNLNLGTGAVTLKGSQQITTSAGNLTLGGTVAGNVSTVSLTKQGNGTLILGGANTYTGGTIVGAGALALIGSGSLSSGALTLGVAGVSTGKLDISGASGNVTLAQAVSGNGTFATGSNTLHIGASLAPGFGGNAGLFTFNGDVAIDASGALNMKLNGNTTGAYDQVSLGADSDLGFAPGSVIAVDLNYTPSAFDTLSLVILNGGSITGSPTFDFSGDSLPPSLSWNTSSFPTTGDIMVVPVPEPAACGSILGGLSLLAARAVIAGRKRLRK